MKKVLSSLPVLVVVMIVLSCASWRPAYSPLEMEMFPPKVREHINNAEVAIGMSPVAVRYSWGAPKAVRVLPTDENGNLREEWIYTKLRLYSTKLTFLNGRLADIVSGTVKLKLKVKDKPTAEEPAPEGENKSGGPEE
jgi:hypothetical protein